jgi:hypothetical protein
MEHLSSKTAKQLKEYAAENGIELGDAKTKTKILSRILDFNADISAPTVAEENNVISTMEMSEKKRNPVSSSSHNDSNVVTSRGADRNLQKKTNNSQTIKTISDKPEQEKVALYASKNLRWNMVGTLVPGYNIVTKEAAEKWLTLNSVRKATAEEVATYYGKG